LSDSAAGVLSTLFDVRGIIGGILAGRISDHLDAHTLTAASFTFSAIPALFFYKIYRNVSLAWSIALMFSIGRLVNGPYVQITTVAFTVLRHWRSRLSSCSRRPPDMNPSHHAVLLCLRGASKDQGRS
jgi:sugar phosphate permease